MDKIILNNNTNLEFNSISNNVNGLAITFTTKTITELEGLMTKENLTKLQLSNSSGEVYGIYNNLECISITKNLEDATVTVNLKQLDTLEVKLEELQSTVDTLVLSNLA